MEIYKILAVAIICAVLIVYIKSINPEIAMPLSVCAGVLLLIMTVSYLNNFFTVFKSLSSYSQVDSSVFKIIIKMVAISYLIEFTATTIEDFGLKAIADKVVFAGKILILTMSAPIIENLIKVVVDLI